MHQVTAYSLQQLFIADFQIYQAKSRDERLIFEAFDQLSRSLLESAKCNKPTLSSLAIRVGGNVVKNGILPIEFVVLP